MLPVPTDRVPAVVRDCLVALRGTHDSELLGNTAQVSAKTFGELEQAPS